MINKHKNTNYAEKNKTIPFDEIIISWNCIRPVSPIKIYLSVFTDQWSNWILYAEWGKGIQKMNKLQLDGFSLEEDILRITKDKATGYKIKIVSESKSKVDGIFVNLKNSTESAFEDLSHSKSILLEVKHPRSQWQEKHSDCSKICSPTCLAVAIEMLDPNLRLSGSELAGCVKDQNSNIYGNWCLNVAECYTRLKHDYWVYVKRSKGIDDLIPNLLNSIPSIVSIQGTLDGAAKPHPGGHLVLIRGVNDKYVYCMDPAFQENNETLRAYSREEFLKVWGQNRGFLTYFFEKKLG
jgi:hypothetical protein